MILITGASGFVGQNLIKFLGNTWPIKAISRRALNHISAYDFKNIDCVIHLAGKAHDLKQTSTPDEYYHVNYELTKNLFNAFLSSDAKKFIFISSVKAAADVVSDILYETDVPDPKTDYGKSKLLAEEYIQREVLPEKFYYILRPCMIYGSGNKGNFNLLYKFVKTGIPFPLASFENKRSFLNIENLCFIIRELILNQVLSGIYNMADDDALSTNQLISILAEGKKAKLWYIPKGIIKIAAKAGDYLKLPLNTETLQKLTENYVVSNQKIKGVLGKELPVSAKDGFKKTVRTLK